MKLKLFLLISVLVMGLSILYIVNLLNQDFVLSKETKYEATLNVWTTTPELSGILKRFQDETNIQMNVKQFQNSELLLEELELTKVNGSVPELVEISSEFGIEKLDAEYEIKAIESAVEKSLFHEAASSLFSVEDELYAFPLGMEVPSLYYNKTLLSTEIIQEAFPFQEEEELSKLKDFQDEKNNGSSSKPFWFFHFDEDVSWYWDSYALSKTANSELQLNESWQMLQEQYGLLPSFDSPMAITRFVSFEVGALASSSKHIQTIQQLIGNRFEFEVHPFVKDPGDQILIAGKGLALMERSDTNLENLQQLFEFLNTEEIQLQLLGATGMLPAQEERLESKEFMQELPMAKYLMPLAKFEDNFTGPTDD